MKRRLGLVVLSFALLLGAYLLYRQYSSNIDIISFIYSGPKPGKSVGQGTTLPGNLNTVMLPSGTQGPLVMIYDRRHVLRAKGRADGWRKKGDWLDIQQPRMEWYMDSGETVYISSDKGIARPKEVGNEWDFRAGKLEENVWVVLDRNTDRRRAPLEERPEDAVRISMEWVEFDQDRLTIQTSSPVRMYSKEADVFGTGLWIGWSEQPWAVRELKINSGDRMIIREGQENFLKDFTLSAGPAESGADAPASRPAKPPRTAPTTEATRLAAGSARAAQSRPATTLPGEEPVVADTYVADFEENVTITSGKRYLKGADMMRLVFEMKSQQLSGPAGPGKAGAAAGSSPAKSARSATAPARLAASAPASQPAEPILVTWTGPLTIKPRRSKTETWQAKRFDVSAQGRQLQVGDERATASCRSLDLWSLKNGGQLTGAADAPATITRNDQQRISAQAIRFERAGSETVAYLDGPGEAFLPSRQKPDRPAELPADQQVQITWTDSAVATLGGRTVIDTTGQKRQEEFFKTASFIGHADLNAGKDQQLKGDRVDVAFIVPQAPADEINRIASLTARGNVTMLDRKEQNDFVAQALWLEMMQLPDHVTLPKKAHATGAVKATQSQRNILAEELDITFQPLKDPKTGRMKAEPLHLDAKGKVHIQEKARDQEQAQDDLVVIDGETVGSDFFYSVAAADPTRRVMDLSAVVTGKPAKVVQAANQIEGQTINVDSRQQTVHVPGAGKLTFLTKRDLDNNKLATPRQVHASWTQSMRYNGQEKMAALLGEVELLTEEDQLLCDKTDLLFGEPEEQPAVSAPATSPASAAVQASRPATRRATSLPSGFNFRPQRLVQFVAEGKKVALAREKKDADGFIIQSMALQSEQLVYQAEGRRVSCNKPGWLGFNDYRAPEAKVSAPKAEPGKDKPKARPARPAGPTAKVLPEDFVLRPAQSAFSWSESMCMQREPTERSRVGKEEYGTLVRLVGDVKMRQCSGSELRLADQLHVRLPEKMPAGEHLVLNCGELLARFGPYLNPAPASQPSGLQASASQPAEGEGLRLGPLELLDAQKKVSFEDKARQVTIGAERILYTRPKDEQSPDMAVILGHLPNTPAKLAQFTYFDTQRQSLQTMQAKELFWNPRTGRIESPELEMHGTGGPVKIKQ